MLTISSANRLLVKLTIAISLTLVSQGAMAGGSYFSVNIGYGGGHGYKHGKYYGHKKSYKHGYRHGYGHSYGHYGYKYPYGYRYGYKHGPKYGNRYGHKTGYGYGYRSGYGYKKHYQPYRYGYRHNGYGYVVGAAAIGAMVGYGLSHVQRHYKTSGYQDAYSSGRVSYTVPASPPGRRLFKDRNGDCFELKNNSLGDELRIQLDRFECDW